LLYEQHLPLNTSSVFSDLDLEPNMLSYVT